MACNIVLKLCFIISKYGVLFWYNDLSRKLKYRHLLKLEPSIRLLLINLITKRRRWYSVEVIVFTCVTFLFLDKQVNSQLFTSDPQKFLPCVFSNAHIKYYVVSNLIIRPSSKLVTVDQPYIIN